MTWLVIAALLALAAVVLVRLERRAIFPAPPADAAVRPPGHGAEVVALGGHGSPAEALFLPARGAIGPAPLIVFFHGNAELADHWLAAFDEPRERGWAALLVEYPGYGRSAGAPSEGSVVAAALAAYDWAAADTRVNGGRIVAFGRSLGGAVAAALAVRRPVKALILESTFVSVPELVGLPPFARWLVADPFDTFGALQRWRGPLLVLHGRRDEVIPFAQGRRLVAGVPGARFVEMPCGHNDCPRAWETVLPFLGPAQPGTSAPGDRTR